MKTIRMTVVTLALVACQQQPEPPNQSPDSSAPVDAATTKDATTAGHADLAMARDANGSDLAASLDLMTSGDMASVAGDMASPPGDMAQPPGNTPDLASRADLAMGGDGGGGGGGNVIDRFDVTMLVPTKQGGREWFLPNAATNPDSEWRPDTNVTQVSPGVFHASGAPRMMVVSPAGKAWWRNVEMTSYVRQTGTVNFYPDQEPHWTMFTRGERHANNNIGPGSINLGNAAPQGTVTWPGYPFNGVQSINNSCLATVYHALYYPQGKMIVEKEITHTEGYGARNAGQITLPNFAPALNRWIGAKFILRNMNGDKAVKLELWIDKNGDGKWAKATETTDTGSRSAGNANLNGCTAAPTRYTVNQVITWAGPWAAFRVDNLAFDFKWLSVREVDPLP